MLTVGPKRGDNKKDSHTGKQEGTYFVVLAFVAEQKEDNRRSYIAEPEKVRNYKKLAERNIIIQSYMDYLIMSGNGFFQINEPDRINAQVSERKEDVPIFIPDLRK